MEILLSSSLFLFLTVCANGQYQTDLSHDICSTWFDLNKCDDSTCDKTGSGYQTRCNLNNDAKLVITSSGTICDENYDPGAPYRLHQTSTFVDAWKICHWCCNYCNETATGMQISSMALKNCK